MSDPSLSTTPFTAMELYVLRGRVANPEPPEPFENPRLLAQRFLATIDDIAAGEENWRKRVARRAGVEESAFWGDILDALDEMADASNDALDQHTERAWSERSALETQPLLEENADLRAEVARLRMQRGVLADVLLHAEARVAQLLDRKRT